jgi:hypothetical protein
MVYTTTDMVADYLGITIDDSSSPSTSQVEKYIDWATSEIEHVTKANFEARKVYTEYLDINSDVSTTSADLSDVTGALNLPYNYDMFPLNKTPVIELISVYYNNEPASAEPSWIQKTIGLGGDVVLSGDNLKLISVTSSPRIGTNSIKVSYYYGRDTVPGIVEKICVRKVALEIMTGQQSNALTQGTGKIKVGDIEIEDPGSFTTSFIKQTSDEMDKYLNLLGTQNYYLV